MTNHISTKSLIRSLFSLFVATLISLSSFSISAKENCGFENNFEWVELVGLSTDCAILDYSVGESNGAAIVVGRSDVKSDTLSKPSDSIFLLPQGAESFLTEFEFPYPLTHLSVTSNRTSMYVFGCVEGEDEKIRFLQLSWLGAQNSLDIVEKTILPIELVDIATTTINDMIVVVGRDHNDLMHTLCFDGNRWSDLQKPIKEVENPILTTQNGADSRNVYLFGEVDGAFTAFEYRLSTNSWRALSSLSSFSSLSGSATIGKSSILFYGGEEFILYNTLLDSWSSVDTPMFNTMSDIKLSNFSAGWLATTAQSSELLTSYYGRVVNPTVFGFVNWIVLFLYLAGMLLMGWYFMQRGNSTDDFYKGGGRIPWWAAGISLFATSLSAITFMAIPAKAFATDLKYFPMGVTILVIAFPIVKYYLPFLIKLNVTTAYEYLEKRFSYAVRLMASSLFIIFMITRIALSLYLPSLALTVVTSIDINTCILMMGVITVVYCTMGGVEAVVWSDVVQGFVLVGGALFAAIFLIYKIPGGLESVVEISIDNSKLKMFDFNLSLSSATFWVILLGGLCNNIISYSSDQTLIQRYITTDSEKSAAKSIILNGFIGLFASALFYSIGTLLYSYYKSYPESINYAMENSDSIFPHFIMAEMPVGLAGLIIAAIFAATMSTVSSNVNSLSTAFTVDIYRKFTKSNSDKRELNVARISGVVMGGVGIFLATMMSSWNILSLLDFFNLILGFLSSGVAALFLIGIFISRVGTVAVILGFIFGNATLVAVTQYSNVSFLLYGFVGLVATICFALIFSLIFKNKKSIIGFTWRTLFK